MLRNTFLHLNGIGPERERKLWKSGIRSWELFIENYHRLPASFRQNHHREQIHNSIEAMNNRNHIFFERRIPLHEKWRAYRDFKANACFLDIETTGLNCSSNEITVIGLYDGENYKAYINGKNLGDFVRDFKKYTTIITFNGWFDKSFIAHHFPESGVYEKLNIDLRTTAGRLGYRGGFKAIEKIFGINRSENISGLGGLEAVILWQEYTQGSDEALDLLVEYNKADVINMKPMIEFAHGELKKRIYPE